MTIRELRLLLERYRKGECSPYENQLVEQWYARLEESGEFHWEEDEKTEVEALLLSGITERISAEEGDLRPGIFGRRYWVLAACTILLLGIGITMLIRKRGNPRETGGPVLADNRVAPLASRAVITLANGQRVYLDSLANGFLIVQKNVRLVKLGSGQIAYESTAVDTGDIAPINTLNNPRGSGVIDMKLADGSQVWLNAGSTISYPVGFKGKTREVTVDGEAYFEIARNTNMPFIVHQGKTDITVLGTHFNVNAYTDDADVKITLLSGAVRVANSNKSVVLKEGEQAQITQGMKVLNAVDLEQVVAWKNGYFVFKSENLRTVMNQLARWYDLEVRYEENTPSRRITGEISRKAGLSEVMKMLEYAGVHLNVEGGHLENLILSR